MPQLCSKTYFMNQHGNFEKKSLRRPQLRDEVFDEDLTEGKSSTKTFSHGMPSWGLSEAFMKTYFMNQPVF